MGMGQLFWDQTWAKFFEHFSGKTSLAGQPDQWDRLVGGPFFSPEKNKVEGLSPVLPHGWF